MFADWTPAGIDLYKPSVARIYDYLLGGKDHFARDRAAAEALLVALPTARADAAANRAFLGRAVRFLAAEHRVGQFLDLGTGLPTQHNVHQIAHPDARVAYVDNDPVVCAHARALLATDDTTTVAEADLRDPHSILTSPGVADLLDFDHPIGVLAVAILHFIPDVDDPWALLGRFRDAVPPGSFLVLTHAADTPHTQQAAQTYERTTAGAATVRSEPAIRAMFDGFDLVDPVWCRSPRGARTRPRSAAQHQPSR